MLISAVKKWQTDIHVSFVNFIYTWYNVVE
jgi:hypothetical protein